jgi:hypothetical protein
MDLREFEEMLEALEKKEIPDNDDDRVLFGDDYIRLLSKLTERLFFDEDIIEAWQIQIFINNIDTKSFILDSRIPDLIELVGKDRVIDINKRLIALKKHTNFDFDM